MSAAPESPSFLSTPAPRITRTSDVPRAAKPPQQPWTLSEVVSRMSAEYRAHMDDAAHEHEYRSSMAVHQMAKLRREERMERRTIALRLDQARHHNLPAWRAKGAAEALQREVDLRITELANNAAEREYVEAGWLAKRRDLPTAEHDREWFDREVNSLAQVSPLAAQLLADGARPELGAVYAARQKIGAGSKDAAPNPERRGPTSRFPELAGVSLNGSRENRDSRSLVVTDGSEVEFGH